MNALNNARVKSVVCTEYTSTFPIPLGIKCDALPACESTDIGHRYIMTTLPCHSNTNPQVLYSADETSSEAVRWKQEYPQYTARNIDTHNVMEVKSHPVVFVDKDHPVISLLRANKEILGSDIDEQSLVQGRWHTVSRQCFNTAVKTLRAKKDFENLFGPAGRDVVQDTQRHKRHQRWHLPDVLKGSNSFLTDRVDGLISDATDSPFTSAILPYQYVENPDQKLSWDVFSYDEGLASRVPYESAARVLTQSKSTHSAYIVRQGLAISMEHNFMMSERGRRDFNNQLMQLVGSIQYTNDLDVHMALVTAPNYERTQVEKYAYSDNNPQQLLRKYVDMYGMCQKNPNGLDILIEDSKQVFKKWGASEPSFMLCNSKLGYQQNMTVEKTQYITNGIDGVKRLKSGPDLKSYRGLNVVHSRHFSMEAGRQPRDLLNRRVRVAEHYKVPPMTAREMANNTVMLYDEGKDQMVGIPCSELYDKSCLPDVGEGDPPRKNDVPFKQLLALETDHHNMPRGFWNHLFFAPGAGCNTETLGQNAFRVFMQATEPSKDNKMTAYLPKFVWKFYQALGDAEMDWTPANAETLYDRIMRMDANQVIANATIVGISGIEYVRKMSLVFGFDDAQRLQMTMWLQFIRQPRHRAGNNNCQSQRDGMDQETNAFQLCHMGSHLTEEEFHELLGPDTTDQFPRVAMGGALWRIYEHLMKWIGVDDGAGNHRERSGYDNWSIGYGMFLPHIATAYSTCLNWTKLLDEGFGKAEVNKYSLLVVRPSIEHYMLGVIVGRGGTGELGATLWGQTELSCYDDAMHGKWGMNYKYHARAVVFNEKHLLRLWDIAFNGYTGGMGTKAVDWKNAEDLEHWNTATVALDEPLRHDFPDMFVMHFVADDVLDKDMPNPINFASTCGNAAQPPVYADAENLHDTHTKEMDVFSSQKLLAENQARYALYAHKMPQFAHMHAGRKNAGHASHEGDTHVSSLSFSGTMCIKRCDGVIFGEQRGTGHLGDSFVGSASARDTW
ncbi:hypothetical protein T484DRAFT_1850123 [Baffinella frigidus]|nr:hypothetical protein T484DRAFT_1850123 [Cryptophyta sp. CCMP2293]